MPTKNAVQNVFNKQKIREKGWIGEEAKSYEDYWYGSGGFGDSRIKQVSNGNWTSEFNEALKGIRSSWGKQDVGKGLEKGFHKWLNNKNICKNETSSNNGCYVGEMEFIDKKGEALFGRIPVRDNTGKHNLYVKWEKCKAGAKASAIWKGRKRSEGNNGSTAVAQNNGKYNWCLSESKSK